MDIAHLRTAYLETEIKKSYGEHFENLASFIMYLIDPLFKPTRNHKDNGIDGAKIVGKGRAIYSAYGPEETTKWNKAKVKLNQDASNVKKFLLNHKKPLRKWCIMLNRNLKGDEYELIWDICKANNINEKNVEIFTPKTLVAEIEKNGFTILVARFLGLISYRDIPFTDLQPHALASKALQRLTEIREEGTESKREELDKIIDGIVSLTYLYSKKKEFATGQRLINDIVANTKVSEKCVKSYIYLDGVFREQHFDEIPNSQPPVSINENGTIVLTVWNLHVIYVIVRFLLKNMESYNIEQILKGIHQAQNTRLRHAQNK